MKKLLPLLLLLLTISITAAAEKPKVSPNDALIQAICFGTHEDFDAALARKPDLNKLNEIGDTPFHVAIRFNTWEFAKKLVEAGADPLLGNLPDTLYRCLRAKEYDFAKEIMAKPNFKLDGPSATRLLPAAFCFTDPEQCQTFAAKFLENGASPNIHDGTAILLRTSSLPSLAQINGHTSRPLHDVARRAGYDALAEKFAAKARGVNRRTAAGASQLITAIRKKDSAAVKRCLANGAWLELADTQEGRTPLQWAAFEGNTEAIKALFAAKANLGQTDKAGYNALQLAVLGKQAEAAKELLAAGADPTAKTAKMPSALELAKKEKAKELVTLFEAAIDRVGKVAWTEDFDAAVAKAKQTKTPVLLFFTGEWCHFCQMLEKLVFTQFVFKSLAAEKVQLVKLDFPRDSRVTSEKGARNARLQMRYCGGSQAGYPIVVMITPEGKEIGRREGFPPAQKNEWIAWFQECLEK